MPIHYHTIFIKESMGSTMQENMECQERLLRWYFTLEIKFFTTNVHLNFLIPNILRSNFLLVHKVLYFWIFFYLNFSKRIHLWRMSGKIIYPFNILWTEEDMNSIMNWGGIFELSKRNLCYSKNNSEQISSTFACLASSYLQSKLWKLNANSAT